MDFNEISNNQMGSNEEKANTQSMNNTSPISNDGFPKRWNFKDAVKQDETVNKITPVSPVAESTGDAEFDKEWAEMMAKEESETTSKFILENQIGANAEMKEEVPVEAKPKVELPKFRSVADIMKGFGNIGGENDEEFDYNNEEVKAAIVETHNVPVSEIVSEPISDIISAAEANHEVEPVEELEIIPVAEITSEVEVVGEVVVTSDIEAVSPVEAVVEETTVAVVEELAPVEIEEIVAEVSEDVLAEISMEPLGKVESEIELISEISSEVEIAGSIEVVADPVAEWTPDPVAEWTADPVADVDFASLVEEHSVQMPIAEFTPEVISETLEAIGLEPAFEINMSPVADTVEDTIMPTGTTEMGWEISNVTNTEAANHNMSESHNTIFNEEFQPIELAGEANPVAETPTPVFVNVEHSWMYAVEPVAEFEDIAEEASFNASLPGELPLFEGETIETTTFEIETHTHTNLKSEEAMKFELPEYSSIIKVIGVGGGGSNAVNHMYKLGIKGVDFLVCNTDKQALDLSPVPHKVVLGTTLTEGRGAGSIPEVGRNAAIENIEDLRTILSNNTKMVFITAGMGGGTGTGAAPVIAGVARELGILTVGIVTVPFAHEGKKRRQYAEEGIELLKQNVDTLLVIRNDKLREMYGNLKLSDAFAHADDVLTTAAKSIAEIISITQQINVDFADICTVMRNSGVAIMGSAVASGENRAVRAVEMSLNSPLLNDNNIIGARYVLLNIISGSEEITMDELGEITDFIQEAAGQTAEIIKGYGVDTSLGDSVSVTIIATGFQQTNPVNYEYAPKSQPEKVVRQLEERTVIEAPKAETTTPPVAETEVNPLEPFLVSKSIEPVAETKSEWTSTTSVEFEIVSTSQEIVEPISELSSEEFTETPSMSEITSSIEESFVEEVAEPTLILKEEVKAEMDPQEAAKKAEQEDIQRRANERIQKLRDISLKLKSPQVLNEMENEPAYKRRNVNLENVPHSSESQVSRFTLTENEEKKIEIRPNNSFLHDNVD